MSVTASRTCDRSHAHRWLPFAAAAALFCPTSVAATPDKDAVEWFHGPFTAALAKAKSTDQPILVYFWKDGSELCGKLYTESLQADAASAVLESYVCVSAKLEDSSGAELFQRFGVRTTPTILMLDSEGGLEDGIVGYIAQEGFFDEVKRIKHGKATISDYRKQIAAKPDDLDLRYTLALKLQDLGDQDGHAAMLADIRKADPDGKTSVGADVIWRETAKEIFVATNDASTADLQPMYEFLAHCKHDAALFSGWDWVSRIEHAKGNREAMRTAVAKAWSHIPEEKIVDWGTDVASKAWAMRDELDKSERKLALEIATRAAKSAEQYAAEKGEGGDSAKIDQFMAKCLNTLACCQSMNGKRREAVATMKRCIELDPENETYKTRLASFKSR